MGQSRCFRGLGETLQIKQVALGFKPVLRGYNPGFRCILEPAKQPKQKILANSPL
jgi:hypothetical protein